MGCTNSTDHAIAATVAMLAQMLAQCGCRCPDGGPCDETRSLGETRE